MVTSGFLRAAYTWAASSSISTMLAKHKHVHAVYIWHCVAARCAQQGSNPCHLWSVRTGDLQAELQDTASEEACIS